MYAIRLLASVAVALGLAAAVPVHAQDKAKAAKGAPVVKVLLENDKVRVTESTFKPGDVSPSRERIPRISHAMKGGTLERSFPDGKKVKVERKTGDWVWIGQKETYSVTNVGKTTVVLLGIQDK